MTNYPAGRLASLGLPIILVIRRILETKKTLTYIGLVVLMATGTGMGFGKMFQLKKKFPLNNLWILKI
jgi:hypothetical protein